MPLVTSKSDADFYMKRAAKLYHLTNPKKNFYSLRTEEQNEFIKIMEEFLIWNYDQWCKEMRQTTVKYITEEIDKQIIEKIVKFVNEEKNET